VSPRWHGLGGDADSPDAKAPGPPPAGVAGVLGDLARRKGWLRRLEGARIYEAWIEIAGEQLALHTEPVRLHGGVLVLRAESAAWATQVRYLSGELAARADAVLGAGQVRQVTVVTGRLEGSPASSTGDRETPL
jgi:predicted nucleic acid-binding Zn ribbon protein